MLHELLVSQGLPSDPNTGQIIEVPAADVPESEISVEISSEPLYCLCQEPWDIHNRKFMIHCDHCGDWYHGTCIGISEEDSKSIEKYHCPKCTVEIGPSVSVDPSKKANKRKKSVRCTPEFIEKLKNHKFNIPDEVIRKMRGHTLTLPYLLAKGFTRPILVENVEALGMKLPPDSFTVRDVERYVGSDRMVDVIDVERQSDTLMSMKEFTDYFTSPNRIRLLNLISLEFSRTNLNKIVEAPAIARKLDWVTNFWPSNPPANEEDIIQRPTVQKYCLISAKDSYTDFHIDFGGSSVWYTVLWGEKVFYFIEPSESNLNIFYRWMEGEMGDNCFLADEISVVFRCVLKKGQSLLIPTGWIHAVYTPEDSLVFGGNFLHSLNMDTQLGVYDIEKRLHTPAKYLFPSFEAVHWYAAEALTQELQMLNSNSFVPSSMIKGLKSLIQALKVWFNEKEVGKIRREYIPSRVNCKKVIHDLCKELRAAEKRSIGFKDSNIAARRDSCCVENGYSVTSSREGSPVSGASKDSLKLVLSRSSSTHEVPSISPTSHGTGRLKLKIKKQPGHTSGEDSQPSPANSPKDIREPRVKIRLSLTSGKAESIDSGSEALQIAEESENGGLISDSADSQELMIDLNRHKSHKKHHHKKNKKEKMNKLKHDKSQNRAINDVLAGTLDGLEELLVDSNYSERISKCETTSQAVKDTVAGMSAMKDAILPPRRKHKKKKHRVPGGTESDSDDSFGGIEKVHQDNDFIYLPLAGSDEESSYRKGRKKGRKKEEDESWSPRAKVGHVGHREVKSSRTNARREAVEKGLEKAAATLGSKSKRKHRSDRSESRSPAKSKKPKFASSPERPRIPSTTSDMDMATKTSILQKKFADIPTSSVTNSKKPKKGMATPKQRLGKILKINKFARF